jgi:tetratricopeptide (TPR) repeat protein
MAITIARAVLLARALRVRPGDPGALYQVGATDLAAGDMDRACATLEKVVKQSPQFLEAHVSPQFLEAHVSLAQVYYRLQKRKSDAPRSDRERATNHLVQKLKAAWSTGRQANPEEKRSVHSLRRFLNRQNLVRRHVVQHLVDTAGPLDIDLRIVFDAPNPKCTRESLAQA